MTLAATNLSQGDYKCYLTVMNAKTLFNHSIVSRAADDQDRGYQRNLELKRAKDIASYLDAGNVIPGCIILSAQETANFTFKDGNITFDDHVNDAFFVIDGQHRLYGSHMANADINLPVYIFQDLAIQEEIQLFLDVNSKQKGVPKTLRIALTKFLSEPESPEQVRLNLFDKLNTDTESALFNRLSSTTTITGKISQVPFQEAIDPILNSNVMKVLEFDKKYILLNNFLTAISDILMETTGDSKRLTTTVYFIALFKNFELICNIALMSGGYKYENFKMTMQPLENIDFEVHTGTGSAANKQMFEAMKQLIESHHYKLNNVDNLF